MADIAEATKSQLAEVMLWLKQEQQEHLCGFYCNKDIIASSFEDSEMLCISEEGRPVGFGIFSHRTAGATIDILEVHPSRRRSGLGTALATHLIRMLIGNGAEYVSIKCSPRASESFWRGLGFVDRPDKIDILPLELWLRTDALPMPASPRRPSEVVPFL